MKISIALREKNIVLHVLRFIFGALGYFEIIFSLDGK